MRTYDDYPRIAWLASDANADPVTRHQYRELAARPLPGDPVEDRPTAAESLALLARARECPQRDKPACSCTFAVCRLDGRDKSSTECLACIRDRLNSSPASGGISSLNIKSLETAL